MLELPEPLPSPTPKKKGQRHQTIEHMCTPRPDPFPPPPPPPPPKKKVKGRRCQTIALTGVYNYTACNFNTSHTDIEMPVHYRISEYSNYGYSSAGLAYESIQ
jgi:hypothetical protein